MPRRFGNKEEVAAAASRDTPYSAFCGTKFFGSLDGLRAISIMGVVWVHATLASPYYVRFSVLPIIGSGAFGVDIFFAISGFLITTLLLRERDKLGKISLREFYLRRTLRIWPLYYATLAFYAGMALIFYRHSPRGPEFFHYFPGYLTFTYTWYAFRSASKPIFNFAWSLSVEEQFYTLWAPVLRFLDNLSPLLIMVGLIALRISASYGLLGKVLPPDSLFLRIATNMSVSICLGVLLAHTLNSRKGFERLCPFLGRKWSGASRISLNVRLLGSGIEFLVSAASATASICSIHSSLMRFTPC
jgi:peptidoglycan/LPS O-acetylase OafA/YrhL